MSQPDSPKPMLTVWTDGACFPNPGKGGWGWTTLQGQFNSGGMSRTTNQVMELTATIRAIETLYDSTCTRLLVISDSLYVIKGATDWSVKWAKNGWLNSKKEPVANKDLWVELLVLLKGRDVSFQWVKGHSGDPGNEEADRLATLASGADRALIDKCSKTWHEN